MNTEENPSPRSETTSLKPPDVVVVTNSSESSIKITWLFSTPLTIEGVRVKWGTDPSESNIIGQEDRDFLHYGGNFEITELKPETRYYIFVYGTLGEAVSRARSVEGTTKPATALPGRPTNLQAWSSNSTVLLTWDAATNASGYKIAYGIEPGPIIDTLPSPEPTINFTGLISNTRYFFQVRSINSNGESASTDIVKQTLWVPAAPTDLTATPQVTTMDLSWSIFQGTITHYIYYGLEPGGAVQRIECRPGHYRLTGLSKNTLYYVEVTAYGANGESLPARITQRTLDGPPIPSRPGSLHTVVTYDSVRVVWGPPTAPGYKVSYGLDNADRKVIGTETTQYMNHMLSNLLPETRYFIEVRGFNASGESEPSASVATTAIFAAPRDLSLEALTDESAAWSWRAGADYSSGTQYEVYLGDRYLDTVPDTHYLARGLTENTEYLFKVRAKGAGDYFSGYTTDNFTTTPFRGSRICSPGNLRGSRNTSTSALLSWDEPYAMCHLCPNAVGYEITGEGIATLNVIRPPCEVKGLNADREYRLVVRAKAGGNNVSRPSYVLIGMRPGTPGALEVGSITSTSARLTWSAPGSQVPVFDYLIDCNGELTASARGLEYQITHLQAGRSYTVAVRARTAASNLSDPVVQTFSTLQEDVTPPSQPGSPVASDITSTSATVTWTASTDNVAVVGYILTLNNGAPITVNGTRHTFDDLQSETSYRVAVKATDGAANVSLPAIGTFQTSVALSAPGNFRYTHTWLIPTLEWDAPDNMTGITGYRIILTGPQGTEVPYTSTQPILKPVLLPQTRYRVRITARNAVEESLPLIAEMTTR